MIRGGSTLKLDPKTLAAKVGVIRDARAGVEAAGAVLERHWEQTLRQGTGQPGGAPRERTGRLSGSIRVTPRHGGGARVTVGTPVFYGRILHYGVPGRIEPRPHGEIALSRAQQDMNQAFRKAAK